MGREIKFRGKSLMAIEDLDQLEIKHENGFVYGNLIADGQSTFIVGGIADVGEDYIAHEWWVKVDPESVGQYTGLKDKNGKEIYEDDIVLVKHFYKNREHIGKVVYCLNRFEVVGFYFPHYDDPTNAFEAGMSEIEVVGNIYENPDLLKVNE